jgi:hypothetical protein
VLRCRHCRPGRRTCLRRRRETYLLAPAVGRSIHFRTHRGYGGDDLTRMRCKGSRVRGLVRPRTSGPTRPPLFARCSNSCTLRERVASA